MQKKILIIGGSSFIGKNFIKSLSNKNLSVYATYFSNKIKINKKFIFQKKVDFTKKKDIKKINNLDFDIIINFGGNINHHNHQETYKTHFNGLKNLVDNLKLNEKKLFIQIGSSLEYGNVVSPQKPGSICKPLSCYGKAKLKATKYIQFRSKEKKFKYIIIRPYQIYGPMQKFNRLIPQVIKHSLKSRNFACTEGTQLRDFLYVNDFCDLLKKIINKKNVLSGIYNAGYGKPLKVKTVIRFINKIIKKGIPNYGKIKLRRDEIYSLYPSIIKTKKNFNWKPKTNINIGLRKTIKFYIHNYLRGIEKF